MKLRQTSYLLTVLLMAGVLYLCTLVLLLSNVRASFRSTEARALGEEKALALAIDGVLGSVPAENRAVYARGFALYDSGGATCELGRGGETWYGQGGNPGLERAYRQARLDVFACRPAAKRNDSRYR